MKIKGRGIKAKRRGVKENWWRKTKGGKRETGKREARTRKVRKRKTRFKAKRRRGTKN